MCVVVVARYVTLINSQFKSPENCPRADVDVRVHLINYVPIGRLCEVMGALSADDDVGVRQEGVALPITSYHPSERKDNGSLRIHRRCFHARGTRAICCRSPRNALGKRMHDERRRQTNIVRIRTN